jgi:ATP-dependent Lon protease
MPRRRSLATANSVISPDAVTYEFPLVPVRDSVIFPKLVSPVTVTRDRSVRAVEEAMLRDQRIVIFTQRDPAMQDPGIKDLYQIGTEMSVGRILRMPDGTTSLLGQGEGRVRLVEIIQTDPFLKARVERIYEPRDESLAVEALQRAVLALFEKVVHLNSNLPEEAYVAALNAENAGGLADLIASSLNLELAHRQEILDTLDPVERLQKISIMLAKELDVLELQNKIHNQVQEEVDKSQREYYLREQMRIIQTELGETDPWLREISDLRKRVEGISLPEEIMLRALKEIDRLNQMPPMSPEVGIIRTYIDWILDLPWTTMTEDNLDVPHAAKILSSTTMVCRVQRTVFSNISQCEASGPSVPSSLSCVLSAHLGRGRLRLDVLSPRLWVENLCVFHSAGSGMKRRYAGTGGLISALCPAGFCKPCAVQAQSIRFSCWMRWISWDRIFAGILPPPFWKCWTRSRTTPFPITTSSWLMTFQRCCLSPRLTIPDPSRLR